MRQYNVAVVGATGAVGTAVLELLWARDFPVGELRLFGSSSVGNGVPYGNSEFVVEALTKTSFIGCDFVFFCAGGTVSKEWVSVAVESGCTVIDNSSAYRHDPKVPLVIPEINGEVLQLYRQRGALIANPNCTTAITLMALWPLHQRVYVESVIASSYQAVSGAGMQGIQELESQTRRMLDGHDIVDTTVFPRPIGFNVIPRIGEELSFGYTTEEMKLEEEGRKIMDHPTFSASITCVRVPVFRCHSVAVTAKFRERIDAREAVDTLRGFPGLAVAKDCGIDILTPYDVEGQYDCLVGRIRRDSVFGDYGLSFFVVGDQILKGAGLNAVQIAEAIVRLG